LSNHNPLTLCNSESEEATVRIKAKNITAGDLVAVKPGSPVLVFSR
jgi:hypothetical protein